MGSNALDVFVQIADAIKRANVRLKGNVRVLIDWSEAKKAEYWTGN